MYKANSYKDIRGEYLDISAIDDDERRMISKLLNHAEKHPDPKSAEFWNFYIKHVGDFYQKRGLTRKETTESVVWRIAQDVNSRLMIAAGMARLGDYRGELENLILTRFKTHRAFAQATGISEDMLSHVLARRKHLGIDTLSDALAKIGYTLHIMPIPDVSPQSD